MKTKIYIILLSGLLFGSSAWADETKANKAEQEIYAHPENIDFEVRLTAPRRFAVFFENPDGNPIYVKVYDMVGNQVAQDVSNQKGRYMREFDMSNNRSEVFLVEVGNARNNSTKRIFLQK
ncbi:MAG: hypothetical protein RMJ97_01170 [Raineya sp.]|nr:hypothetical protein [Raineya sp.]MDW8295468.1 hypothetical protein [Raineya sp.]